MPAITISNAEAIENQDKYLVFNLHLSEYNVSSEPLTVELVAKNGTAKGTNNSNFKPNKKNQDFARQNFQFSIDEGNTWLPAENGNEVTFGFGQQNIQVRIPVNDDNVAEGFTPETMQLEVKRVLSDDLVDGFDLNDIGTGSIYDNDNSGSPVEVEISDTNATEGKDDYLIWDVSLSASNDETIVLDLETEEITAKGGLKKNFKKALKEEKKNQKQLLKDDKYLDFDQALEISADDGKTWQPAPNDNQLVIAPEQTEFKVRTLLNDDSEAEAVESVNLRVENVVAGQVDDISDTGVALIVDDDVAASATVVYQAEDATYVGPKFFTGRDSEGSGYIDYQNPTDDYIEWVVEVSEAGTYELNWRYANGSSNRPLELSVNSATEVNSLSFPNTGNWRSWDFVTQSVELNQGSNTVRLEAIGSSGANFDWLEVTGPVQVSDSCTPISLLPCSEVRVEGSQVFNFDGSDGGLSDKDNQDIGFTMVDPSSNPGNPNPQAGVVGYWPEKIDVVDGVLKLTATPGIQFDDNNSLDNALGVGLNLPSQNLQLQTTLVDLPAAAGGYAQAGLWFGQAEGGGSGTSEDNYIKLVLMSPTPGNYVLQALMEKDGVILESKTVDIADNLNSVSFDLFTNANNQTVTAQYSLENGSTQTLGTFTNIPQEWFSFDQAGIDPTIGTRSFGGIFATERNAGSSQVFSFEDFSITEGKTPPITAELPFDRWSIPVDNPTAMAWGPDQKLYVATLFGDIHVFSIDPDTRTYSEQIVKTIPNSEGGNRLTLGLAIDPDSTADNVILWVAHSSGSVNNGSLNSGKISRLSGTNFNQKQDVITGLPRAIANHATNNIDFGPDGRLYIWQGGNTGAGAANDEPTEFGDRPEQVLTAALLVADVKDPNFNGNAASNIGEFSDEFYARTGSDVEIYATGLRNTYDGVFHSNGNIYAPDNGLGVTGTVPPVPRLGDPSDRSITTLFGENPVDNPGKQNDPLNLIVEGGYYGHPNPYRDEVVFKDGSFQGFNDSNIPAGHPDYQEPFFDLGTNKSANGIIEYTADNFFGQLQGDLLITNYSQGDDLTRIELSDDGLSVKDSSSLIDGFSEPLPIAMGEEGSIFVGEFNGDSITVLEPLGIWRDDLPTVPQAVLDAGSTTLDGKLYMIGGKTSSNHVSSVYVYDPGDPINPNDDLWTSAPNLPGPAVENAAVATLNGKIYVFGGSTAPFSGAVDNAAVFDPATSSWSTLADMPTARGGATAQVINNKIYVVGGLGADGASLNTVEIFDPLSGSWESSQSLQTSRDNPGSAVIDDQLYVFGGRTRNADGSTLDGSLITVEIFDPSSNSWRFGTSMPTGRRAMAVGTINDRIQVIGGEAEGGVAFDTHEEYNPVTDEWRTMPAIETSRHGAAFGTIDDVIYVAAGGPAGGSAFTAVTEAFSL